MILSLGGSASIELWWSYDDPPRLTVGRVTHLRGGRGRALCWTTLALARDNALGDGPKGYSTREPFRCEACGAWLDIRNSTLHYESQAASHVARAKRGLRVV